MKEELIHTMYIGNPIHHLAQTLFGISTIVCIDLSTAGMDQI